MINEKTYLVVEAARDLMYVTTLLRQGDCEINLAELHHLILKKIDNFTTLLERKNFSLTQVSNAKYLVCAALDEAEANYLITKNLQMTRKSLISYYYNEELGGENFFTILENLKNKSLENMPIINLGYLLLCLGFRGQYAIRGENILKEIMEKTYLLIKQHNYSPSLLVSNSTRVQTAKLDKPNLVIPLVFFLTFIYLLFISVLNYKKHQLHQQLDKIVIQNHFE